MVKICPICRRPHDKKVTCNDYQSVDDMFVNLNYISKKGFRIEPTKNLSEKTLRQEKKSWNEQAAAERAKLLEKYKK